MAVFITGGHGHIGSWTANFLIRNGEKVFLYDINPVVPDCLKNFSEHITFIPGDVLDFPKLTGIFNQYRDKIDGIIHTVGIMGELVLGNPHRNVMLNISGTHNMVEIARLFKIPKVVYTSTGAVYGEVEGTVAEDQYPSNPSDLYGATKASSEFLGLHYASTFGFDFRIARIFFCYGPGKMPSHFIRLYQMAFGALEGLTDLNMDRGADQELDFTFIEDAARGTALLYAKNTVKHHIYNIATGYPTRVATAAELSQKYSRFPVKVQLGPGQIMKRCKALDIKRAMEELDYKPEYTIEQGVKKYANWMDEVLK